VQGSQGLDAPDTLYWPTLHGKPAGALVTQMEHFVECVRRGEPSSVVTPEEALAAVAAVSAAERSAQTGKVVRMRQAEKRKSGRAG
jgi:predicted dehydrogenase